MWMLFLYLSGEETSDPDHSRYKKTDPGVKEKVGCEDSGTDI